MMMMMMSTTPLSIIQDSNVNIFLGSCFSYTIFSLLFSLVSFAYFSIHNGEFFILFIHPQNNVSQLGRKFLALKIITQLKFKSIPQSFQVELNRLLLGKNEFSFSFSKTWINFSLWISVVITKDFTSFEMVTK